MMYIHDRSSHWIANTIIKLAKKSSYKYSKNTRELTQQSNPILK